jgi:hypothetical protein
MPFLAFPRVGGMPVSRHTLSAVSHARGHGGHGTPWHSYSVAFVYGLQAFLLGDSCMSGL